jgi:hypothetical protein
MSRERRPRWVLGTASVLLALSPSVVNRTWALDTPPAPRLSREALIRDIRELSEVLENAHPDPYINGGGKVAYHRRLQALIRSMPDDGLDRADFHAALLPFIARVGDGHTVLLAGESERDDNEPGGLPFVFEVVEDRLYVDAVAREEYLHLIGATLDSIEGVPFAELLARESLRQGHDNELHAMSSLARRGALFFGDSLRRLVPEWKDRSKIHLILRDATGKRLTLEVQPLENVEYPLRRRSSSIEPAQDGGWFGYRFLDLDRDVAYLWIHNMTTYREMFEVSRSLGSRGYESWARRVYEKFTGGAAPESVDAVIEGIPPATDVFRSLCEEMKAAGSKALIVDLRRNFGGNDLMVPMLLYFLVGFDQTVTVIAETAAIQKMSPLFDQSTETGIDLAEVPYSGRVPLVLTDYDFSLDARFMEGGRLHDSVSASLLRMFRQTPTFSAVFEGRQDEGCYLPERIMVLSGNATQSSGFDLMTNLHRLGAEIVGVPSSQAGNSFGNIRHFMLPNSKLEGYVATKYFVQFPDEAATGYVLQPDHTLTFRELAARDFDPNATLLLALELLETGRQ